MHTSILSFIVMTVLYIVSYSFLYWRHTKEKEMVDKYAELWYNAELELREYKRKERKESQED